MKYDITTADPDLIEGCLAGHEAAWEALVGKYERLIFATCRRYGLQQAEAEDVFGRICLGLLQHLEGIKDRTRLAAWLVTTTSRECWHYKKPPESVALGSRQESADEAVPLYEPVDETPLPEEVLLGLERQQQVRESLARLQERCRKLLYYLFYDPNEPPYTQIGAELGLPVASIGPNRARCLDKLKQELQKLMNNS